MEKETFLQRSKFYRLYFLLLSICLLSIVLSSFNRKDLAPDKLKFLSMVMKIDSMSFYANKPRFSHFIFQSANKNSNSGRKIYELIVYAIDSSGNQLNSEVHLLEKAKYQQNATFDRDDEILLANYIMSKKRYFTLISGVDTSVYKFFRFDPIQKEEINYYANYVTYKISIIKSNNEKLTEPWGPGDYLKPSPPAKPTDGNQ